MRWRRATSRLAVTLAVGMGLAGCGDSDGSGAATTAPPAVTAERAPAVSELRTNRLGRRELNKVRDLLDRLVAGVSAQDPAICTRVYSRSYVEHLTKRRGAAAVAACRKDTAETGVRIQVVQLERVDIKRSGGTLTGRVQFVMDQAGGLVRMTTRVVRRGDGYRIVRMDGEQLSAPPQPPEGLQLED